MEEETVVSSEIPVKKVVIEDPETIDNPIKETNGDLPPLVKGGKRDDEETTLDGEFIKVDKESLDIKYASGPARLEAEEDEKPVMDRSLAFGNSSRELLEALEKMKELEIELERVAGALKHSESENNKLKDELLLSKEKLEENANNYKELESSHKKLEEQMIEAEEKYAAQLNNFQEALQAQEAKQKELIQVKEAFDGLNLEFENSRKRMQELEHELQCSVGEARKFEELHKQSGSHAESEAQRALEFERLLESAKLGAKEMEDQMGSLQEELKGLHDKIAENKKIEETLQHTNAELCAVQEELTQSKSLVLVLEQSLSSKEDLIGELTQELEVKRASESKWKEDFSALENLFAETKQHLEAKFSELEDIKLKLQEGVKARESVEAGFRVQEEQFSTLQEDFSRVLKEKEALETAVADFTSNAAHMTELCGDLEEKLKLSDENFCKTDSLLSQALSNNEELEKKLKSLEELHNESGAVAATATQKNLDLEDLVQASNNAAEEAKSQLRELEARFIASELRNVELEQQLNLVELKCSEAERELKEFSGKISDLAAKLTEVEEEKKLLNDQTKEYQVKIGQLESALNQSSLQNSELEKELKFAMEKSAEHEDRASMSHLRSIELEDLFQASHSKLEDTGKKVNELELLLAAEKYRIQELELQIATLEKKCGDAEADSAKHTGKVAELTSELEALQSRASSLEIALQAANEKERELTECLNIATDEKKRLEEASNGSSEKLNEAENLVEVLRNELNLTQEKLKSIENDLQDAGLRESEIMEKLKSAEEQLEEQGKVLEQASAKNSELESLHESLSRDAKLKLEEVMVNFTDKDSEAKFLSEKIKVLEEQVKAYEEQVTVAAGKSISLNEELDQSLMKLASLESTNEKLKGEIVEAENKASQSFSESELLVETNIQLKSRVAELEELLNSAVSEKEADAQELESHMKTIAELTGKHSTASELQAAAEARIIEAEAQMHAAIEKFTKRNSEANGLNAKLIALEDHIKKYEDQVREASTIAETRQIELEESFLKLKNLESFVEELQTRSGKFEKESSELAETNLKLTQELAAFEYKLSDLEGKLSTAITERDETSELLQSSNKAVEDLTQQITSEGQRLQAQIASLLEENNLLNESYQKTKNELQSVILEVEGKLKEEKENNDALQSEIQNLKAEIAASSMLQTRVRELEEQLMKVENQLKEEVESVKATACTREAELTSKLEEYVDKVHSRDIINEQVLQLQKELQIAEATIAEKKEAESQKGLDHEVALNRSVEELEDKNKEVLVLKQQVKDLEQRLQLAESKAKSDGGSLAEMKDGAEIKSRDFGLSVSSPSKRKSKKKSEAASASAQPSSSLLETHSEASPLTSLKFIFGVVLVSVIVGIILGKRY